MKAIFLSLLACALLTPAVLAAPEDDVIKPIHQFIDSFDKGDVQAALATYAAGDISIIDEVSPFVWLGPDAPKQWAADLGKQMSDEGITDAKVTYEAATRVVVNGKMAYVILPTAYLFKQHGTAMKEEGQMTFSLRMEGDGWKIAAWTWTGGDPHPA